MCKVVADSKSRVLGNPRHEFTTPGALKRDFPEWYESMYVKNTCGGGVVVVVGEGGPSEAANFDEPLRLVQVRELLGCRASKHTSKTIASLGRRPGQLPPSEDYQDNRSLRRTPSSTLLDDGTCLQFLSASDKFPRRELLALQAPPTEQGVLVPHPATTIAQAPAPPQQPTPPPTPQQPTLAALPAPKPTDLSAHIARMAEI